jgi:toxin ParE1/3/4
VQARWLTRTLNNLDEEAAYIARDDPEAAARMVDRIATGVHQLASHPALGRPGRVQGTRELVIAGTPYVVPYRVRNETVEILRIFHGARKRPEKF